MKRNKQAVLSALAAGLLMIMMAPGSVWGLNNDELQNFVNGNVLTVYLPQQDYQEGTVRIQVGSSAVLEGELREIEGNGSIQTLILFDNSLSISTKNRQKMKQAVRTVVEQQAPGEQFAFATFDTEVHVLTDMSADTGALLQALDGVQFQNQDTWLKNCLYGCIGNPSFFSSESCARILVCSDGCDDNPTGYTAEEVRRRLRQYPCDVLAIGSRYDREPGAVSELFSFVRSRQSCAWLLDDYGDDLSSITEGIKAEKPGKVAVAVLEDRLMDGEEKRIRIQAQTGEDMFSGAATVVMPFTEEVAPKEENAALETVTTIPAEETEAASSLSVTGQTSSSEEENGPVEETEGAETIVHENLGKDTREIVPLFLALLLIPLAALVLVLILLLGKKKKPAEIPPLPRDDPEWTNGPTIAAAGEDDKTEMQDPAEDDGATVLLTEDNGGDVAEARCLLTLENEDNPQQFYTVPVDQEVIIGRKPECGIVLEGDKSVSGHHCVIYRVGDDLMLRDNNSSNGTWLNHQKLTAPERIDSGDVIGIGRSRWVVSVRRT